MHGRVLILTMLAIGVTAGPAAAADPPRLVSSSPADGEHVQHAPAEVSATFDEPLAPDSTMSVSACERPVDDGTVEVTGETMSVGLAETPSGDYTVVYRTEDTEDAEATTGQFSFTVESGPSCDGSPTFVGSYPEDGSMVHRAPDDVWAEFSEELDGSSTMSATACGHRVDDGNVRVSGTRIVVGIARKHSARYTVSYEATAESESTPGQFTFTAHLGEPCNDGGNGHNHNNNNGNNNGNGNHPGHGRDRHGGRHDRNRDHDAHAPDDHPTGHEPEQHVMSDHGPDHGGEADHGHDDNRHARDHGRHDGGDGTDVGPDTAEDGDIDTDASSAAPPSDEPDPPPAPQETTLVLALGVSVALGLAGGRLLRALA